MKLGDNQVENIPVIPSGSLHSIKALGVGGYPKGRAHRNLRTGIFR